MVPSASGDRICDRDGDGTITLSELSDEVADAMKLREKQRHGYYRDGIPAKWPLARAAGDGPVFAAGKSSNDKAAQNAGAVGDYVSVLTERGWEPGRVREIQGDKRLVRLYHYSDNKDIVRGPARLKPMTFRRYPVGVTIKVYWGNRLWDAEVTAVDGDFHRITYPGWPSYWDEWVMSDRIAGSDDGTSDGKFDYKVGAVIDVEWRGHWYPAVIMKIRSGRALIHYREYDDSWDEWVPPGRMRRSGPR